MDLQFFPILCFRFLYFHIFASGFHNLSYFQVSGFHIFIFLFLVLIIVHIFMFLVFIFSYFCCWFSWFSYFYVSGFHVFIFLCFWFLYSISLSNLIHLHCFYFHISDMTQHVCFERAMMTVCCLALTYCEAFKHTHATIMHDNIAWYRETPPSMNIIILLASTYTHETLDQYIQKCCSLRCNTTVFCCMF